MRLAVYMPKEYPDRMRVEEEIPDEDYLTRPEFYKERIKQKFITEFGSGKTKTGKFWEWSPISKGKMKIEITEEPRIVIPEVPVAEEEVERIAREASKVYARGARVVGMEQYWREYRALREAGLSPGEARDALKETRFR